MAFFKNLKNKLFKYHKNTRKQQVPDTSRPEPDSPVTDTADPKQHHTANSPFDLIHFENSNLEYFQEDEQVRQWRTEDGDMLELFYYPLPPDIEADMGSLDSVRGFYQQQFTAAGWASIRIDLLDRGAGWQGILVIGKFPQEPSGMTYVGSITIPFRDFSYVLRMICREHGTTGVRDSVVMMEELQKQNGTASDIMEGWGADPYDPDSRAELQCNQADAEIYDEQFPDHPLSRLRRMMTTLQDSLELDGMLLENAPFTGQGSDSEPDRKQAADQEQDSVDIIIGGIYAVRDDPDEPFWLTKVIHLEENIAHTVRYSLTLEQVPEQLDEEELITGVDRASGTFGAAHLPLPVTVLARYGVLIQQAAVSHADYTGYQLFMDSLYECLDDASPQWLKEAISHAAWRYNDDAMAALVDRYLIGVDLARDSKKALYWLNRLVDRERLLVRPGTTITDEEQIVFGGIYAFLTENGGFAVSRIVHRDTKGVQQLFFPFEFARLPADLNPVELLEQAEQESPGRDGFFFHAPVSVEGFLDNDRVYLGSLPLTAQEIHCYREYLRAMYADEEFQESIVETWLRQAREGDAASQYNIALAFMRDDPEWEIEQDYPAALRWFTAAANQGHALAAYNLAIMYQLGEGTAKDDYQGFKWLLFAAEKNCGLGQKYVAAAYFYGQGCSRDLVRAHAWFSMAVSRDNGLSEAEKEDTRLDRDSIAEKMNPEELAAAEEYFQKFAGDV
jgi:TPR repeat protein